MAKFLIVDDDPKRRSNIVEILVDSLGISKEQIDEAYSHQTARRYLKQQYYVAVFLDMALPKYDDDEDVDPSAGAKILREISRDRLKKPNRIFGFTALNDNIPKYSSEFKRLGFELYLSIPGDLSWLGEVKEQILYSIRSVRDVEFQQKDLAIITVHGILTFGDWQESLIEEYQSKVSQKTVDNLPFKFTGIDVFTFILPYFRKKIIKRLLDDLDTWLSEHKAKRIVCFSHSFGTYVLIKALEKLEPHQLESISLVVLSGSVLDEDYNFKLLFKKSNLKIINDCAKNDIPLLLSKSFVFGSGMAGRVGFRGLNNERIVQRFFNGGHSSYFKKGSGFIENYWLPLLDDDFVPLATNKCKPFGIIDGISNLIARFSSNIKALYYLLALGLLFKLVI